MKSDVYLKMNTMYTLFFLLFVMSCSESDLNGIQAQEFANVEKVMVSGDTGNYTFSVTIASPDTGCEQYADWWEVLSEDGQLLYRRILAHSHVDEQPFTRSGGPVNIGKDDIVWVRAHMNNSGYGGTVLKGSIEEDFRIVEVANDFAKEVEKEEPLPKNCAF